MCGIAIILDHHGRTPEAWRIRAMQQALAHRGQDAAGLLRHSAVALAHTRLSIVDAAGGAQPMVTDDLQAALVYNGELYNFQDLRGLLQARGIVFRTRSDTEVVLQAYREFGAKSVAKLRGMFAFAIHDRRSGGLFLARDRLGIKPLYYYNDADVFVAASEMKALFASGLVKAEIDPASIKNYFTYQFSISPYTPFARVYELPPAHTLQLSVGSAPRLERYWDVEFPQKGDYESMDESYWKMRFGDALQEAIASHAIGDVPIGAYLSGGIDSCTVTRLLADRQQSVQTFSIGFENPDYDESPQYRAVAQSCGLTNVEIRMQDDRPGGFLKELVECIFHLEQPQRMAVDIPHYLLSGLVRKHQHKVVYTGDGADEVLAGYDCFRQDMMRQWSNGVLKRHFRRWRYLHRYTRHFPAEMMRLLLRLHGQGQQRATIERFGFYPVWHDFWQITHAQRHGIMRDDAAIDAETQMQELIARMQPQLAGRDALNQSLYFEMKTRLPGWILWKSDRLSMAHGVEARLPFLDHPLVELLARMPPQMKLKGLDEKYVLKQSVQSRLPPSPHAYKKRGFYTPIRNWFFKTEHFNSLQIYLSRSALIHAGLFDPKRVADLQKALLAMNAPTDMNSAYRQMQLEWTLFTVLTTQILHQLFVGIAHPRRFDPEPALSNA